MAEFTIAPALAKDFLEEEDFSCVFGFDDKDAWSRLHSFPNITEITISPQTQSELGIVVGRNISDEHRWKAIAKDKLQRVLRANDGKEAKLVEMLQELEPGTSILIEYVPEQSSHDDLFLVYADVREIHEASELVRKLELLQRLKLKLLTEKIFQKRWIGKGADREIEGWKRVPEAVEVETEALGVYPIRKGGEIRLRTASDVRDGFVELLPVKWKVSNMPRKIADQATQVKPPGVSRVIQTEPTFPSNAATQYLFDAADRHIDPSLISREWLDRSTESLSKEVQFNLIDLYKNEYGTDVATGVDKYQTPRIDEVLSFMNRSLSVGRTVCSMDWHPELSGIFVASYTFEALSKLSSNVPEPSRKQSENIVHRMLFEKCPILMWSFKNPLEPLLELKSIREVTAVSFCPYDGELFVGGLTNGQIALWDLKGEIERVEQANQAVRESNDYRKQIRQLMENTSQESVDRSVSPAAVSSLEHASRSAISCIKWLPRNHFCTTTGHLKAHPEKLHRFVVTSSLDGTVCIWDLDFSMPALQKMIATKKDASKVVEKTIYQRVNNLFFPTFKLLCRTPIASMIVDEAFYLSTPEAHTKDITQRVKHLLQQLPVGCKMKLTLGTFTGQLLGGSWEGYDFEQGSLVTDEPLQVTHTLAPIHDGPIVALERNPLLRDVFLSIGGHVLALWSEEDCSSAIFWRKKQIIITAGRWSLDRAAVFYVGLANGDFEIWDLNMPNEEDTLRKVVQHELCRKTDQAAWTKTYNDRHATKTETQLQAVIDAKESEPKKTAEKAKRVEVDAAKGKKQREIEKRTPLSDRLEQQYRAKHYQSLLKKLMQRRNVSPERMAQEMRPEMERRRYNAEKRSAIDASISQADGDFANVQRVLRPAEKSTPASIVQRSEAELPQEHKESIANYRQVEAEAKEILRGHFLPEMEHFVEVLMKSREQRDKVCINVGTNMEHLVSYENKRSLRRRGLAPRTRLEDLNPISETEEDTNEKEEVSEKQNI
uniref:WD repeat-containing protein 63 n=1 Tax=Anopheles atroparvus TaxID=41427 RepID=A0A182ISW1_ANOAO